MKKWLLFIGWLCLVLIGCENQPLNDPTAHLVFSQDTLSFDTVFTHEGSATRTVVLHNPHKKAITISSIRMEHGDAFRLNVDGEVDLSQISNVPLAGGDSLFIFVRATITPDDRTQPLLVEDKVLVEVGDHTETLQLQAYGWDVNLIDSLVIYSPTTFTDGKPYLIRHWVKTAPGATLTLAPGCHLYMHDGAFLSCQGALIAEGTQDQRIRIQSDRLDNIYEGIPYVYVGGKWDGIYAYEPDSIRFRYVDIISGNIGAYVQGKGAGRFVMEHCRVHNHSIYGVVLQDINGTIANSEISNCAEYGIYLSGGKFEVIHTTLASYFNSSTYAVQTTARNDTISPMYIYNLSKQRPTEVLFLNSILAGAQKNCLRLATPLPTYYDGEFAYCYLQTVDSLSPSFAHDIVYSRLTNRYGISYRDTMFVNTYYGEKGRYYDFHLDSASLAIDIADSIIARRYPLDLDGNDRLADGKPDAGCYEWTKKQ